MQIHVDADKCQGHTLCAMRAPKLFELSDIDGHASAIVTEVPIDQEADAMEAYHSCPEQAIVVS